MTSEQFINKYGETFFKAEKLGSFYNDVHKLISCHVEKVESLESQLKEVKESHLLKLIELISVYKYKHWTTSEIVEFIEDYTITH